MIFNIRGCVMAVCDTVWPCHAVQRQTAVTAYLQSKQLLLFAFALRRSRGRPGIDSPWAQSVRPCPENRQNSPQRPWVIDWVWEMEWLVDSPVNLHR